MSDNARNIVIIQAHYLMFFFDSSIFIFKILCTHVIVIPNSNKMGYS